MAVPTADGPVEPMGAWARMRSPNPDVRRDAIETAHDRALAARDPSVIVALVAAERFHAAMLERAGVSQYTVRGKLLAGPRHQLLVVVAQARAPAVRPDVQVHAR